MWTGECGGYGGICVPAATSAGYVKVLRDEGLSYNHVADRLNSEGFETRQGKLFKGMPVYRMLKRVE